MKPRIKSKTHWFNIFMAVLTVAESNLVILQPLLGDNVYSVLLFITLVGNAILRELTKEGLQG